MAKRIGTCTYCRRELAGPRSGSRVAATADHVMPQSVGGRRKVPCCRQCNNLKGDIHPSVWRWFTEMFPAWWRTFRTNGEVVAACRPQFGSRVQVGTVGRARREEFEGLTNPNSEPRGVAR